VEPQEQPQPTTVATEPPTTGPTPAAQGGSELKLIPVKQNGPELTYAARTFLKQLQERTDRVDALMVRAAAYRTQSEAAAAALGNENRILYHLRNNPGTALTEVRNYENLILGPISVYKTLYGMTRDGLIYADEKRPADDLGEEGTAATEANIVRLKAARRECLVAAAELFTRIRRFEPAEKIYLVLLDLYEGDASIQRGYDAMCRLRDMPEGWGPFWERGMGGGRGGRDGGGGGGR
jgi:hypothetical protein